MKSGSASTVTAVCLLSVGLIAQERQSDPKSKKPDLTARQLSISRSMRDITRRAVETPQPTLLDVPRTPQSITRMGSPTAP